MRGGGGIASAGWILFKYLLDRRIYKKVLG
jgi:hypothetical protein